MQDKQNQRPIPITCALVEEAYGEVRRKRGAGGVDGKSLVTYEKHLGANLYKLWNRMSSGSYFPSAVKEVLIPKEGGRRKLGVPTIEDRVAQTVVKRYIEPRLEAVFHSQSYGYRPHRGAHEAVGRVRENCLHYNWVLDLDITGFFDNIDHELLLQALERHVKEPWIKMYIKRWLKTSVVGEDGELQESQDKGTPQGGVISPLLANLFLHYVLDKWLKRVHKQVEFVRYADDVIIHCQSRREGEEVLARVKERLRACRLSLNERKTQIVCCRPSNQEHGKSANKFDFLGFSFQPRSYRSRRGGEIRVGFLPAMSAKSGKRILQEIRKWRVWRDSTQDLESLSKELNPRIRGWVNYYGKYRRYELGQVLHYLNKRLARWLQGRYKRLKGSMKKAYQLLQKISEAQPNLFYHWEVGLKSL